MNDSADMMEVASEPDLGDQVQAAARRLKSALDSLERGLAGLGDGDAELKARLAEAETLAADRAELANRLDSVSADAKAARDQLETRERDFAKLARETDSELDTIRAQIERALGATEGEGA